MFNAMSSASNSKRARSTTSPHPSQSKKSRMSLSPSQLSSPEPSATVNGVVASLSPQKERSRFFHGELTDGESVVRVVGFEKEQRQKLADFYQKQQPVTIRNCQVSMNKITGKPEVVIKSYTTLENSEETFNIQDPKTVCSPLVSISNFSEVDPSSRVTLKIAVLKVKDPTTLSIGKRKQELVIADSTGHTTLALWEEDIDMLEELRSYQLNRVLFHMYNGNWEVSFPSFGASFEEIPDLEDVDILGFDDDQEEQDSTFIEKCCVVGVKEVEHVHACISCKRSIKSDITDTKATCDICGTYQLLKQPKTTAKLYIEPKSGQLIVLRANGDVLQQILSDRPFTCDNLLEVSVFNLTHNKFHSITNITR